MTSSSVYCFVSSGRIHCVPVNSVIEYSNLVAPPPTIVIDGDINGDGKEIRTDIDESRLKIRNKNLLYTLNNPSLSDIESDVGDDSFNSESNGDSNDYLTNVIDNYAAHSLYLPEFSINLDEDLNDGYGQIKQLLKKVFKTWQDLSNIEVKRLTGGITNMLLKCTYNSKEIVLMRVYGQGTNLIIDRHREFILHLVLNSMHLAPPVHARFKNGLVYGFLQGRSLEPNELKSPNLYPLIAQQLGNWHSKININEIHKGVNQLREYTRSHKRRQSFQQIKRESSDLKKEKKSKKKYISSVWELIEDWIDVVPVINELIESFQNNTKVELNDENIRDFIKKEFKWLKDTLESHIDSPIVSSHGDLLSGNIIIPSEDWLNQPFQNLPPINENPIKFIDYEYMLPAPRAFDIANHLAEWQGFDCDRSAIPQPTSKNETMVNWVKAYLNNSNAGHDEVKGLINEIASYYGLPGFYWGIWSVIQSEISNIDFNYSTYATLRLQEYWDWKNSFVERFPQYSNS